MRDTVVVIDDEPGYAETVAELLAEEGYAVATATDGRSGLDVLRRIAGEVCLVLLDLAMPVLDGRGVLREMQAAPELASIPVIIATSDPSRAPAGVPVLTKPFEFGHLLSLIRARC